MEPFDEGWSRSHAATMSSPSSVSALSSKRQKRMKIREETGGLSPVSYTDPFSVVNWEEGINSAKFGSVTKEIEALLDRRAKIMKPFLEKVCMDVSHRKEALPAYPPINTVNDDIAAVNSSASQPSHIIIIDSDDEEPKNQRPSEPLQDMLLNESAGEILLKHYSEEVYAQEQSSQTLMIGDASLSKKYDSKKGANSVHVGSKVECKKDKGELGGAQGHTSKKGNTSLVDESKSWKDSKSLHASREDGSRNSESEYVTVEDLEIEEGNQEADVNFDGLDDIWKEMSFGLECSKDFTLELRSNESTGGGGEECEHSFILKDDLGLVCRICGVISKSIDSIIEYQNPKNTRSTRTYHYEGRTTKDGDVAKFHPDGTKVSENDFCVAEIYAHPRHKKQMKPHQIEGFNFLLSNLVTENPGGCILAHAPGSGKTFMLISFIQSFMAKYPSAKPLVILPRGILPTWKKEFKRWQIEEDLPLFDFYSSKADNRSQQLEVLKQWVEQRSILFLGYKQFSSIVCDNDTGNISTQCQDILLICPTILILDEGHTPRNQDTDVLTSLEKVQTPRKVVLSGTLYQNHVKEVFNILNLVRPKFLRMETSKSIKKRILSRVPMSSRKNMLKKSTDNEFYDLVELALVKDDNFKRKVTVIEDLREMTSKVLHYYKGDFLDELPGLVDFSVFLNLSSKQKREVTILKKSVNKFKMTSDGSAVYVHPELKSLTKNTIVRDRVDEGKIDELLNKLDLQDGVKAKFFLNLLKLCESTGEKLLVFGQYLLPLKFLERLAMKVKGWSLGKEIFMITGDSDSDYREQSMDRFNSSVDAKVFFGSIKACGEGISLVGASRIIILDVHLNPSVTRQAIGRAFRPGQERKVYTYRLVAADAPEADDHYTCFRKESISKMWFEWNEHCGYNDFEMEEADISDCGDKFLETSLLSEDVAALYKR